MIWDPHRRGGRDSHRGHTRNEFRDQQQRGAVARDEIVGPAHAGIRRERQPADARKQPASIASSGEKPGVVDGHIAIREYLSMTLSFDHDIIDGAPAARFVQRLKDLIQSGYGLAESEAEEPVAAW